MNITDWIGAIGVFLILLAFFLNLRGILENTDISYMLLNFIGASIACFASILLDYIPFIVLECIWAIISLMALIKYWRGKE